VTIFAGCNASPISPGRCRACLTRWHWLARPLSKLEQQGLIQAFVFTHELAWNVLKDYLEQQGIFALIGSRDASRSAFQNGLVTDGEAWMDMIKARNLTSHTYNPEVADSVTRDILVRFYPAFAALRQRLDSLALPGSAP